MAGNPLYLLNVESIDFSGCTAITYGEHGHNKTTTIDTASMNNIIFNVNTSTGVNMRMRFVFTPTSSRRTLRFEKFVNSQWTSVNNLKNKNTENCANNFKQSITATAAYYTTFSYNEGKDHKGPDKLIRHITLDNCVFSLKESDYGNSFRVAQIGFGIGVGTKEGITTLFSPKQNWWLYATNAQRVKKDYDEESCCCENPTMQLEMREQTTIIDMSTNRLIVSSTMDNNDTVDDELDGGNTFNFRMIQLETQKGG